MTRRRFIRELIATCSAVFTGIWWLAEKTSPRKFVRAARLRKYPGRLMSLKGINSQGKWSG